MKMTEQSIENKKDVLDCFKKYMKSGLYSAIMYGEDDELLENFFEFIDILEEKSKDDESYYTVITDCYEQLGDNKKAIEAFNHYYSSKNKKHIKRMYELQNFRGKKATRPSKRKVSIPSFKYVSKKLCKELFEEGAECPICGKKKVGLYVGDAYVDDKVISFADGRESFCSQCIKDGKAAKKNSISFNSTYILGNMRLKTVVNELVYNTPGVDQKVFQHSEDGWMICCDNFCVLDRDKNGFYVFKCNKCKKTYEVID